MQRTQNVSAMSDMMLMFTGDLRAGVNPLQARVDFSKGFALSKSQLEKILTRAPIIIKKELDKPKAHSLVKKLWKLGWHSEIHRGGVAIYSTPRVSPKTEAKKNKKHVQAGLEAKQVVTPGDQRRSHDSKEKKASSELGSSVAGLSLNHKKIEYAIKSVYEQASGLQSKAPSFENPLGKKINKLTRKLSSSCKTVELLVPGTWHEATQLNTTACLQAGCVESDAYLVVIPQSKTDLAAIKDLNHYANTVVKHSATLVKPSRVSLEAKALNHSRHSCMYAELVGSTNNQKICYLISVFESDQYYYTLYIWSLLERVPSLKELMLNIIRSSKVVSKVTSNR